MIIMIMIITNIIISTGPDRTPEIWTSIILAIF